MEPHIGHVRSAGVGPDVVLLHSSGSSGRQWDALTSALQSRYRLHAIDLHGHGATSAWSGTRRMRLDDDLGLLMPLLRAPVHLVGHSYGGALALRLAALHPERVASVAVYEPVVFRLLLDYHPRDRVTSDVLKAAQSIRNWHVRGQSERAARRFVDYWSGEGAWERLGPVPQQLIASRMGSVAGHFDALFHDTLTRDALSRIRVPVLCMTGAGTRPVTRRVGELLRYAMPHAVHEVFAEAGHLGPITHAKQFAQRVAGHLDVQYAANDAVALMQAA